MRSLLTIPLILTTLSAPACAPLPQGEGDSSPPPAHPPRPLPPNLHTVTPQIISGATPDRRAFAHLASLNVRTIISVDGAPPDTRVAAAHGIRTLHIPVGYDRITNEQATAIIAAVRDALTDPDARVFIHCHHGKHRGPTAAALCAIALNEWSNDDATEWMRNVAHTAPRYAGLYDTAARFTPPTAAALDAVDVAMLPAVAPSDTWVDAMVRIDKRFDRLKAARADDWSADAPADRDPAHLALLLEEDFRELRRALPPDAAADLRRLLVASEADARTIRSFTEADRNRRNNEQAEAAFRTLRKTCTTCHRAHRD